MLFYNVLFLFFLVFSFVTVITRKSNHRFEVLSILVLAFFLSLFVIGWGQIGQITQNIIRAVMRLINFLVITSLSLWCLGIYVIIFILTMNFFFILYPFLPCYALDIREGFLMQIILLWYYLFTFACAFVIFSLIL